MNAINARFRRFKLRALALILSGITVLFAIVSCADRSPQSIAGLTPETVVDYIHRVIQADRTVYSKHVVDRLVNSGQFIGVSEQWQDNKTLPLPAQVMRMGAELASGKDKSDFNYHLISSWNINDVNAPKDKFEKKAMKTVEQTGLPFKGNRTIAGKRYFSALYPDKAVVASCVSCHNQHPVHKQRYPDKVFKPGDVMGGVLINLPL